MKTKNIVDVKIQVVSADEPRVMRYVGVELGKDLPAPAESLPKWYNNVTHVIEVSPHERERLFSVPFGEPVTPEEAERLVASFVAGGWHEVPYRDE